MESLCLAQICFPCFSLFWMCNCYSVLWSWMKTVWSVILMTNQCLNLSEGLLLSWLFKGFIIFIAGVIRHSLTWDHSMATHWGQGKLLQICRVTGRGEWVHFHSSTWENCPWLSSSTHSTLRSCQPPLQDTEHWVQGPCSQLLTKGGNQSQWKLIN